MEFMFYQLLFFISGHEECFVSVLNIMTTAHSTEFALTMISTTLKVFNTELGFRKFDNSY